MILLYVSFFCLAHEGVLCRNAWQRTLQPIYPSAYAASQISSYFFLLYLLLVLEDYIVVVGLEISLELFG